MQTLKVASLVAIILAAVALAHPAKGTELDTRRVAGLSCQSEDETGAVRIAVRLEAQDRAEVSLYERSAAVSSLRVTADLQTLELGDWMFSSERLGLVISRHPVERKLPSGDVQTLYSGDYFALLPSGGIRRGTVMCQIRN
jgi:hypothetical protein